MSKHKYMIGFLFIFLLLIPFKVNGEQLTERVMIIFNNEIDYKLLEEKDLEVHHIFEEYDAVSVTIPVSMRDNLNARPNIRFIEEDPEVETTSQTASWGYRSLDMEDVKQKGLTGKGIKIGILDTGVRTDHPDLHISGGATFVQGTSSYNDDFGHGTHVAGVIASQDNDLGTVGVAPDAQLYAVKVLDNNGKGNQSDVVAGINWAMEQGLDIINLSITSPTGSVLLQETLQKAYDQGMLIIAASGNLLTPVYENINVLFPAQYSSVIAVGSVNENLVRSAFSYYGQDLDFVAPGENIYSTYNGLGDGEYQLSTGTSMAAPFVTGMAALYKEAYPTLNSTEILSRMERLALDLGDKGKDSEYGYGLIQPPPSLEDNIFPDVPENSWYKKEVNNLYINGIINGYGDGSFYPYQPITRAEAVTMIGRALKVSGEKSETSFLDVPYEHFASGYINSTTNKNIIVGFQDQTFRPNTHIIRGDVAVILQRAFGLPNSDGIFFSDVDTEKHYFNAINSLAAQNISKGFSDGTFKPDDNITRAQFSVFLSNSMK